MPASGMTREGWYALGVVMVLGAVVYWWPRGQRGAESSPARIGQVEKPSSGSSGDCSSYSREGWLIDHDKRGEVTLWELAGSPRTSGQKASGVVTWPAEVIGEPMITTVSGECLVDGIIYYDIKFDETRQGWVDVDYLAWRRPTTD